MDTNFWIFSSIALITTIITTIVIAIKNQKYKKRADELLGELVEIRQKYSQIGNSIDEINQHFDKKKAQVEQEYLVKKDQLNEQFKKELTESQERMKIIKQDFDFELKKYKELELYKINSMLENQKQRISNDLDLFSLQAQETKKTIEKDIEIITSDLESYRAARAAINEDILREREKADKLNFYCLSLSKNEIDEINYINQIKPKLNNAEILNKLIYECYYRKPLQELVKRVLRNGTTVGIYKITYIPTGEIYIGKSTNIAERWKQHIKSSLNIGTIAHSQLHTTMEEKGVWNFSFEVLEEVDKENLTSREKYYINFYESDKYGLNQKVG